MKIRRRNEYDLLLLVFLSVCRSFGDDMHVQLVEIEEYEDTQ